MLRYGDGRDIVIQPIGGSNVNQTSHVAILCKQSHSQIQDTIPDKGCVTRPIDARPVLTLSFTFMAEEASYDMGWAFHQRAVHVVGPLAAVHIPIAEASERPKIRDTVNRWLQRFHKAGRIVVVFHGKGTSDGRIRLGDIESYPEEATCPCLPGVGALANDVFADNSRHPRRHPE